jgi:hypothetical protein
MTTRRDIIEAKYNEMRRYIDENLGVNFFPSLDDIDTADILILIAMYFTPHYESGDYQKVIKDGLRLQNLKVDDAVFDKHYPVIKKYINWFVEYMKSN